MMNARNFSSPALRASTLTLCVLGLLGALACSGSFDTQKTAPSSRPGTDARNGSLNPNSPGASNGADTDPTGSGEQGNDISGISTGSSSRGGARSSRAPRANPRDAGEFELADAGADDAGVIEDDAGADDAGADDAGLQP